jgi:hypothetical protein
MITLGLLLDTVTLSELFSQVRPGVLGSPGAGASLTGLGGQEGWLIYRKRSFYPPRHVVRVISEGPRLGVRDPTGTPHPES